MNSEDTMKLEEQYRILEFDEFGDDRGSLVVAEGGGQDIPFIACEIWGNVELAKEEWQSGIIEVNRQIAEVVEKTENCEMISSAGLEHTVGDEVHFAPEGMRMLGRRYAAKYLEVWGK